MLHSTDDIRFAYVGQIFLYHSITFFPSIKLYFCIHIYNILKYFIADVVMSTYLLNFLPWMQIYEF